jgi:alkylated DNA repair dioxygenase AlkB
MASDQSSAESGAFEFQGESLDLHNGHAVLFRGVFCPALRRQLFAALFRVTAWQQHVVTLFGRSMPAPRLSAWHGDPRAYYRYSGQTLEPVPWTDALQAIRSRAEVVAATRFNSVLSNLYRSGQDGVGWHSDDERGLGTDPVIASVSLGATRRFDLRHKARGIGTTEFRRRNGPLGREST